MVRRRPSTTTVWPLLTSEGWARYCCMVAAVAGTAQFAGAAFYALCGGCPDGVLCAPRSAERMALLFYLTGWLSHKTLSTRSGACNLTPARSPAL